MRRGAHPGDGRQKEGGESRDQGGSFRRLALGDRNGTARRPCPPAHAASRCRLCHSKNSVDALQFRPDSRRQLGEAPAVNAMCELIDLNQGRLRQTGRYWSCDNQKCLMNNDHPSPMAAPKPRVVVYACSGCSDAGEIADRVARQLTREGIGQMSCLAGIGGRVNSLMATAEKAQRILVVDGCPLNCARRTLELAGFKKFAHLELHRLGIRKGSAPVTEEGIASGVAAAKHMLAEAPRETSGIEETAPTLQHRLIINHATAQPVQTF